MLKRSGKEFQDDNLTDWAAALTYYGVLAIFPALLVLVSVLGLIGESATQPLIDNLGEVAPGPAQEILTNALENLQGSQGAAGFAFILGLVLRDLVGIRLRRRVHARLERDLRHRGGPADLEDPAAARRADRCAARARRHQRRRRGHHRRASPRSSAT